MSVIQDISARTVEDSRGEHTIACTVVLEDGTTAEASVPHGKSAGSHEAVDLPAEIAEKKITEVATLVKGKDSGDQKGIDDALCSAAGEQKKNLGGNTTLVVSIAIARAHAYSIKKPLWKYIRDSSGIAQFPNPFPKPFVNLVNGGAHSGNMKLFQEYILVPQRSTMKESLAYADDVRKRLGEIIAEKYPDTQLGDEGGFALKTEDPVEPFALIAQAAGEGAVFALDAAATESGYGDEARTEIFMQLMKTFPLLYIEDPYGEEEFEKFAQLQSQVQQHVIVGDDLTTTNVSRMEKAHEKGSITGVIIKPNQIGTVTEALAAVAKARAFGWQVIASHRSGETEDSFIADFAYGVGADGIKIGASVQKERWAKYARLQSIEQEITRRA